MFISLFNRKELVGSFSVYVYMYSKRVMNSSSLRRATSLLALGYYVLLIITCYYVLNKGFIIIIIIISFDHEDVSRGLVLDRQYT